VNVDNALLFILQCPSALEVIAHRRSGFPGLMETALACFIQLSILLLFERTGFLLITALAVIAFFGANFAGESMVKNSNHDLIRVLSLSAFLLIFSFLLSAKFGVNLEPRRLEAFKAVGSYNVFASYLKEKYLPTYLIILMGLLLNLSEANFMIRVLLRRLRVEDDESQFQGGRIIGILERIIFYVFILLNEYSAIGFILAAKGIIRVPQMKEHNQYLLIGTTMSLVYSIIVALFVKVLIQIG
jgi:hypothetical protein